MQRWSWSQSRVELFVTTCVIYTYDLNNQVPKWHLTSELVPFFSFLSRKTFLWDVTNFLEARRHLQGGYSENSHVLSKKCSKNMKFLVAGIFFYDFSKKYWEIVQTCEYRWLNRRKSGVPRLRV